MKGFPLLKEILKKEQQKYPFNSFSAQLPLFFFLLFSVVLQCEKCGLLLGGHCSTISSALENFSGSKRERLQSVDGCVLCSITALTDIGKGRKQEGVKEAGRQGGGEESGLILGGL